MILFHSKRRAKRAASFEIRVSIFVILFATGCGAPGEPTPPISLVPVSVTDLMAHQAGDAVQLTFTLPTVAVSREKLAVSPSVEILRGSLKLDGSLDMKSFHNVYTIPGALLDNYRFGSQIVFNDPIAPVETKAHPGAAVEYIVRTRVSQKRASADSNVASVRVFPVPEPISSVEIRVTESAIELRWSAPAHTSAGDMLPLLMGYNIYRGESAAAAATYPAEPSDASKTATKPVLLDFSTPTSYRDTSFVFDHTYVYTVRSVIQADGNSLESSDSQPITVIPRDIFPPAAPQSLVVVPPHCLAEGELYVDLSWSINLETDLAGYRVYRSEEEGKRGDILESLWLVPSYRDHGVPPGRRYWYRVTALDRAGNESPASTPVSVLVEYEKCTL